MFFSQVGCMTIPLNEFWKKIESLGICDKASIQKISTQIGKKIGKDSDHDSVTVAKYLIKRELITRYQAKLLLSSKHEALRSGSYLILSDEAVPPFAGWFSARSLLNQKQGFLTNLALERTLPLLLAEGSSQDLRQDRSLQKYAIEVEGDHCRLFTSLPEGETLAARLIVEPIMNSQHLLKIGKNLAEALVSLHSVRSMRGSLLPEHVWVTKKAEAILLLEPSTDPSAASLQGPSSRKPLNAPEVELGGESFSEQSDLFLLGCLLFRMATGEDPYPASTGNKTAKPNVDTYRVPDKVANAGRSTTTESLIFRVLAHAIAPRPESRFSTVQQFLAAWIAVESSMEVKQAAAKPSRARSAENTTVAVTDLADRSSSKLPVDEPRQPKKDSIQEKSPSPSKVGKNKKPSSSKIIETKKRSRKTSDVDVPAPPAPEPAKPVTKEPAKVKGVVPAAKAELKSPASTDVHVSTDIVPDHASGSINDKPLIANPTKDSADQVPSSFNVGNESDLTKAENKEIQFDGGNSLEPATKTVDPAIAKVSSSKDAHASDESEVQSLIGDLDITKAVSLPSDSLVTESSATRSTTRRQEKKSNAPLVLGGMCVAVLVLLIGLIVSGSGDPPAEPEPQVRRTLPDVIPPVTSKKPTESDRESEKDVSSLAGYEVVEDERLLFVPPYGVDTDTAPLTLLPPGPTVIVSCKLSQFLEHPSGKNLLTGVASGLESLVERAISRSKSSADNIHRVTVTLFPGEAGWPEVALAVELINPVKEADLVENLAVDQARTRDNQTIYVGEQDDSDAYYWRLEEESDLVSAYAVGSVPRITEVANLEGTAIPLPRTSQALWSSTSVDSELLVFFTPNFLFADGREMLNASAPELIDPLRRFMQPDVNAGLMALQFNSDGTVYVESRFAPSGGISEAALMKKVSESINSLPSWADDFILESVPDASWRLLAIRMPQMMNYLITKMRFGLSDNTVVANAYLPQEAFPQLVFAGLLAMNTSKSGGSTIAAPTEEVLSIDQMLERQMTVSFDQESLEFALEAISNAFQDGLPAGNQMPKAVIVGGDLELMGITQNQQVRDFSKDQKSLRSVLTDLVLQANPDKSATGPTDAKQSLIWVVTDSESETGKKEIRITTRQAAERENYTVPNEFTIDPS